ncbi:alpha/beta hydrolase [Kibdelosporangium phytohabitans]|uniref:Esterase n=1 Tax=Kibdelosporangium phytohabitans TaxID=860235 RepID=A0A0N9I2G4_9PSEU|nr:alpha/beta hydrolase-fold protein [Kibdelosporangium phytohabitans]ALG08637.1 esterase [Kibdelosporangium phytohabitans]MBE1470270.1 S-formylglutathione hydrolase FrmB [Kibdelosporangium phytohabitans]
MTRVHPALPRGLVFVLAAVVAVAGFAVPSARAAGALPRFADGIGLTVVSQPAWAGDKERTFTFTVRSDQVPAHSVLPNQVSGEHVISVTVPTGYDNTAPTRYPVLYSLHGGADYPDSTRNQALTERSTEGVPLITVMPNGGGRGWYSNWVNPGPLGKQNWETFHLDQVIPLIDANLMTIAAREGRAIAGHSMGGFGAFHYAEHRPELFSYAGSFSGGLDLLSQEVRGVVAGTQSLESYGKPTVAIDAIFGPPVWPLDGVWNAQSPAQHVGSLRGMGVAMYVGNGGDLTVNPIQAAVENRARETALVTATFLTSAGIPFDFLDYGDGSAWAPGCTGKHNENACLQADLNHFVPLIMKRLQHPGVTP